MRNKRNRNKPNLLLILVDDLRFDEFGAGGHPYMKTPHIDRIAHEGALFERAFHTTPICSPNRASILTGQYASRHGIIDNVARDLASHRLPNYHLELQRLGTREQDRTELFVRNQVRDGLRQRLGEEAYENFLRQLKGESSVEYRIGNDAPASS